MGPGEGRVALDALDIQVAELGAEVAVPPLDGTAVAVTSTLHTPRPGAHQRVNMILLPRPQSAPSQHMLPSLTSERVFTHGDFHPGNVLWRLGRISGVVDWSAARLDARWCELAYCRAEVCLLLGPDIADRLADAYSNIVGETSDELPVYDLMCVFSSRYYAAESLDAYREQGHAPNSQLSLAHSR